jgi:hypothetical protein
MNIHDFDFVDLCKNIKPGRYILYFHESINGYPSTINGPFLLNNKLYSYFKRKSINENFNDIVKILIDIGIIKILKKEGPSHTVEWRFDSSIIK